MTRSGWYEIRGLYPVEFSYRCTVEFGPCGEYNRRRITLNWQGRRMSYGRTHVVWVECEG
jgi:hypothetical protein